MSLYNLSTGQAVRNLSIFPGISVTCMVSRGEGWSEIEEGGGVRCIDSFFFFFFFFL